MKVRLDEFAFPPVRAYPTDAGIDLMTPTAMMVPAHGAYTLDTGVHVQLPHNTCGLLVSKSGLNVKFGITGTGLIDEGYTGSICVKLYNNGDQPRYFERGDKVIQLVVLPCLFEPIRIVQKLDGGERGDNGFGSTGR